MENNTKILAYGVLPAMSAVGFYGSMYLAFENGLLKSMIGILRGKSTVLPNTKATVIRKWTGIKPIDDYLAFYLAFFVPIMGKNKPSTTLQNRFFIGQFSAMWTLLQLQAQKSSNSSFIQSRLSLMLMAFGIQTIGAATVVPLFLATQLATNLSSNVGTAAVISESRTAAIPLATILTILIPLGMGSYVRSQPQKQALINVFQVFYIFAELVERTAGPVVVPTASAGPLSASLTRVYNFAEGLSILSYAGTVAVVLLTKVLPNRFPKGFADHVSFRRVFLPRIKLETHGDLYEARVHFLRWDAAICLSSFLLWSLYSYVSVVSTEPEAVGKIVLEVMGRLLVTGPIGAATHLLRQRDIITAS